ncbi:MAG: amino acid racemase [Polyangiaceae bacterium]|nr:amino acid racemase [Polyangiaceae bacterium]
MRRLGIVGGLDWQSTVIYYEVINREIREACGGQASAAMLIDSLNFQPFASASTSAEFQHLRETLVASSQALEAAGVDGILLACNTLHRFSQSIVNQINIPFLHIVDATAAELLQDGHRRVGLLGTRATMESAFYKKKLTKEYQLDVLIPEKPQRDQLNHAIIHDLNTHGGTERIRELLNANIATMSQQGATAVILGCTELGLAWGNRKEKVLELTLPAYDSAILHALEGAAFCRGKSPIPKKT